MGFRIILKNLLLVMLLKKIKQFNKKNVLMHRFVCACACGDEVFTTLNTFGAVVYI